MSLSWVDVVLFETKLSTEILGLLHGTPYSRPKRSPVNFPVHYVYLHTLVITGGSCFKLVTVCFLLSVI